MKLWQSMVVSAVVISGCSSAPTEQEIDAADFGLSMSEETCLAVATPFITQRMGDPESVIFENLKCYRGLEGRVPVARVEATYGYRFAGDVDSKGEIGRYTGMTPFSGIVRDDGDGPRVVRYCIPVAPRTIDSVFPPWLIEKQFDFFSSPLFFSTSRCHLFEDALRANFLNLYLSTP